MESLQLKLLNDRYLSIKKIGSGSYSEVWLAYDITTKSPKALKIGITDCQDASECELDVLKVIKSKSSFHHHLNWMDDYFSIKIDGEDTTCIVFDLMAGSVNDLLKKNFPEGMPLETVVEIIRQVAIATDALHKIGYVHTDIKPENLLVATSISKYSELFNELSKLSYNKIKKVDFLRKQKWIKKWVTNDDKSSAKPESEDSNSDTDTDSSEESDTTTLSRHSDESYRIYFDREM